MNRLRTLVDNERGVALVMALTILLTLTGMVVAFLAVSAFEPQISRNHVDSVRARHVAESGIEYAYNFLVDVANINTWSTYLAGATCTTGAVLPGAANTTLPGLSAAHGTFTVLVRNDCKADDNKLTGVTVPPVLDPGGANTDTNNKLILISTGTIGNTTRTIRVVISKTQFPPINGALSFPGLQSDVNFSGSAFTIDGRSHLMADSPGSPTQPYDAPPVYGITVKDGTPYDGDDPNEVLVENALANNQQNVVKGKNEANPTGPPVQGANTVQADNTQTAQMISDFVTAVRDYADIKYSPDPSSPVVVQNIGDTCATNVNDSNCWGTEAKPKIVYINGQLPSLGTQMTSLAVSGTSVGTGILIVENGNAEIAGNFRWNGPIIITGNNVSIKYLGGGNQSVYGTAIVNEMNNNETPQLEGEVTGNANLLYSNQALTLVRNLLLRRFVRTYSWSDQ